MNQTISINSVKTFFVHDAINEIEITQKKFVERIYKRYKKPAYDFRKIYGVLFTSDSYIECLWFKIKHENSVEYKIKQASRKKEFNDAKELFPDSLFD
jgi:hypothetical protein